MQSYCEREKLNEKSSKKLAGKKLNEKDQAKGPKSVTGSIELKTYLCVSSECFLKERKPPYSCHWL